MEKVRNRVRRAILHWLELGHLSVLVEKNSFIINQMKDFWGEETYMGMDLHLPYGANRGANSLIVVAGRIGQQEFVRVFPIRFRTYSEARSFIKIAENAGVGVDSIDAPFGGINLIREDIERGK